MVLPTQQIATSFQTEIRISITPYSPGVSQVKSYKNILRALVQSMLNLHLMVSLEIAG